MKAKIDQEKICIPPYISTTWDQVAFLRTRQCPETNEKTLQLHLKDGSMISIPNLDPTLVDISFSAHLKHLEENKSPRAETKGGLFQILGIKRIPAPVPVDFFIAISVMIYYFSLGTSFSPGNIKKFLPAHAALAIIKFMIVPLVAIVIALLLPIGEKVRAVIIIQSFMPAAIYSVVTSILFRLDSRMASSLFVFNTVLFLFVVLPLLFAFRTLFIQ